MRQTCCGGDNGEQQDSEADGKWTERTRGEVFSISTLDKSSSCSSRVPFLKDNGGPAPDSLFVDFLSAAIINSAAAGR